MSEPINPITPEKLPAPSLTEQMELVKFLREQSEANRSALREEAIANRSAQRAESEAIRKLFTLTSSIVAIPLAVALALAGIFWYRDMNTMKEAMKQEGEAAAKLEIKKMDAHIDETLQAQFNTKSMQDRIDRAAEIATAGKAKSLIEDRVRAMIDPLQKQAQASLVTIHIQELIASANADDATAVDQLLSLRSTAQSDQRRLINAVITERTSSLLLKLNTRGTKENCMDPDSQSVRALVESTNVEARKEAIANCYRWFIERYDGIPHPPHASYLNIEAKAANLFVDVAVHDPSLNVRAQAIWSINSMFAFSPGFPPDGLPLLDLQPLQSWWQSSKAHSSILLLLARVKNDDEPDIDSLDTYEEILNAEANAPLDFKPALEAAISRMRSSARGRLKWEVAHLPADFQHPDYKLSSCSEIRRDLMIRFPALAKQMSLGGASSSGAMIYEVLPELNFLPSCPVDDEFLERIEDFAADTACLSGRYESVSALNKIFRNDN